METNIWSLWFMGISAVGTLLLAIIAAGTIVGQFRPSLKISFSPSDYEEEQQLSPDGNHKVNIYVENIGNRVARLYKYKHRKVSPLPPATVEELFLPDSKETREPFDIMPGDKIRMSILTVPEGQRLSTEYIIMVKYKSKGMRGVFQLFCYKDTKLWFPAALNSSAIEIEERNFSHFTGRRPLNKLIRNFEKH